MADAQQPVVAEQTMSAAEFLSSIPHLETCILRKVHKGAIAKCDCQRTVRAMEAFAERARLAERERCAEIADAHSAPKVVRAIDYDAACADIALAIRSGKEPA